MRGPPRRAGALAARPLASELERLLVHRVELQGERRPERLEPERLGQVEVAGERPEQRDVEAAAVRERLLLDEVGGDEGPPARSSGRVTATSEGASTTR
jgi:hypothetical protein